VQLCTSLLLVAAGAALNRCQAQPADRGVTPPTPGSAFVLLTCCRVMCVAIILTSTSIVGVVCSQHTNRCTITLHRETQQHQGVPVSQPCNSCYN
jgi:hypothetical protein